MIKKERIVPRQEDFAKWYTSIVHNAELVVYGSIKGTIIFQPNAWALWESIQTHLNRKLKQMKVKNMSLPFLIPINDFNKEKEHIEGFAPELFTITKVGDKEIPENYVVRPTSEIPFCQYFKYVVSSYKSLPIKVNQWCSVMRAEKTTKPFLRTSEFHWHELHAIFATREEAYSFAKKIIDMYEKFMVNVLCIPVIKGEKTIGERFAGADNTFTVEGFMQDGQMLQCGTSHYLGQNFARSYDIQFQTKDNSFDFVHQMSAGVSTRLLGALIMVHGDDNGLLLPPRIAPTQIMINTVGLDEKHPSLKKLVSRIKASLKGYRVNVDTSDKSMGYKLSTSEILGTPLQIVCGKRTLEDDTITIYRRDTLTKEDIHIDELKSYVKTTIKEMKTNIFNRAQERLQNAMVTVQNIDELKQAIENKQIAIAPWGGTAEDEKNLKTITNGITPRCIYKTLAQPTKCFFTGKETTTQVLFARAY